MRSQRPAKAVGTTVRGAGLARPCSQAWPGPASVPWSPVGFSNTDVVHISLWEDHASQLLRWDLAGLQGRGAPLAIGEAGKGSELSRGHQQKPATIQPGQARGTQSDARKAWPDQVGASRVQFGVFRSDRQQRIGFERVGSVKSGSCS